MVLGAIMWLRWRYANEDPMKQNIHPQYEEVNVRCSCGNTFKIRSTAGHDIDIEVCSLCHPFYTGKQKIVDTGGRVEAFKNRFAMFDKARAKKS